MAAAAQPTEAQRLAVQQAAKASAGTAAMLDGCWRKRNAYRQANALIKTFDANATPTRQLLAVQALFDGSSADIRSSTAGLQLLADSQLVPGLARLLTALLMWPDAVGAPSQLINQGTNWAAVRLGYTCILCARILRATSECATYATYEDTQAVAALGEQLAAPPVLTALAAAAKYVMEHVPGWSPSAQAVSSNYDMRVLGAELVGSSIVAATNIPLTLYKDTRLQALCLGMPSEPIENGHHQKLLSRAISSQQSSGPTPPHPDGEAALVALQHALAALRDSGVLSAASSALLAAPPYTPLERGATKLGQYVIDLASAQNSLAHALQLVGRTCTLCRSTCAIDLLSAPPVLQFRMLGLTQLVASRKQQQQQPEAPAPGAGAGGHSASGGTRLWPLLHRGVRALYPGLTAGGLSCMYQTLVEAAVAAVGTVRSLPLVMPSSLASTEVLTPTAAAQRIFPAPQRTAALLARASAAACSRLEYLVDPRAGDFSSNFAVGSPMLLTSVPMSLRDGACAALACASPEDAAACMPDVLAVHAWCVRAAVSSVAQAISEPDDYVKSASGPLNAVCGAGFSSVATMKFEWLQLGADVQEACARALLPTRLMASLDATLRLVAASEAANARHVHDVLLSCSGALSTLFPAMLRARLLPTTSIAQAQAQRAGQGGVRQRSVAAAAAAGDAAQALTGSAGAGGGSWRLQDELGVVVTTAKLARREAAKMAAAATAQNHAAICEGLVTVRALNTVLLNVSDGDALPALLLELDAARVQAAAAAAAEGGGSGFGGSAQAQREAALSEACRAMAEAIALCCLSALELQEAVVRSVLPSYRCEPACIDAATAGRAARNAVACACAAAVCLPTALMPAADVRRLLAETARLLMCLREGEGQRGSGSGSGSDSPELQGGALIAVTELTVIHLILHLSADEDLLAAFAPGWLWAEPPPAGADAESCEPLLLLENLAALADAPDATPPGPVVVLRSTAAAAALGGRPWAEHAQCWHQVAALARSWQHAGDVVMTAPVRAAVAAALTSGGSQPWPPRLLKLCANPECSNFGGACEADLKLKSCSGCRAKHYCCAACSRAHWPAHKAECRRLAAARAAGAGAAASAGTAAAAAEERAADAAPVPGAGAEQGADGTGGGAAQA